MRLKNQINRTPLTKEELRTALSDFSYFCERCVVITDKNGKRTPLRLNVAQKMFADLLLRYIFAKRPKPMTLVVLKARQMGYTTVLLALELYILIKFPNTEYAALNLKHFLHQADIAREIMEDKMRSMIENLHPSVFGDFEMNKRDMLFHLTGVGGKKRNNKLRFHTALGKESGRGGTAQGIILDECFSGDVEIMTDRGFVRFDQLKDQKVAQWDNGEISFVKPLRKIKKKPTSQPYKVKFRYDDTAIVTGGHNFLLRNNNKISPFYGDLVDKKLEDISFHHNWEIPTSGFGAGDNTPLTALERVLIALQADGYVVRQFENSKSSMNYGYTGTRVGISLKKPRKIAEWEKLYDQLKQEVSIKYESKVRIDKKGRYAWEFTLPGIYNPKDLTNHFSFDCSSERAEEILLEMAKWDGSFTQFDAIHYGSVVKNNSEFFATMATLAGYDVWFHKAVDNRSENFSDYYRVNAKKKTQFNNIQRFSKTPVEYDDYVYCVTVPSGYIVVRIGKHNYVVGNCAFYQNLTKIQNGVVSSLPSDGLSTLVYVSTANGFNGFYDMCQLAKTSPNMEFMFLPWFIMEEYVADDADIDETTYAPHEIEIIEAMEEWNERHPNAEVRPDLFKAKIAWYRDHLTSKKGNDLTAMRQEFPTTEDEPFTSSDAPVFPSEKVIQAIKHTKNEGEQVEAWLTADENGNPADGNEFDAKVFKKPVLGRRYMVTVDPAFGGQISDNTSIRVNDLYTLEDMAVFASRDTPEDIAPLVVALAKYFNNATVNVENNAGHLLISLLRNQYRYSNLFIDPRRKFDRTQPMKAFGTRMGKQTKSLGIERLRYLLNSGKYMPKDMDTLQEMLHFSYVGEGANRKAMATGRKDDGTEYHDDLVMGLVNFALSLPQSTFKGMGNDSQPENQTIIMGVVD